jgi:RHS repeat-associated protein
LSQSLTGGTISITAPQHTISDTTNRIITAGYGYDAAGNLTNDTLHSYAYDAENRIKTLDGVAAGYKYDAAGLRVQKGSTVYVYSGTKVIAEYASGAAATSPSKEYVYSGTSLLATVAAGATTYSYPDHLSTRVEANSSGTVTRTFGHLPFGEVWYETGTASKWKFTSYERDSDTGLDYAIFRSYSSRLGRFMQQDPLGGRVANPQSLNRFAYALADPTDLLILSDCSAALSKFKFCLVRIHRLKTMRQWRKP